jgi:hypothetical protein
MSDEPIRILLESEIVRLRKVIELGRIATEPFDDVKPRKWATDYEKLREFHRECVKILNPAEPWEVF